MTQRRFKIGDRYTFNEGLVFEIFSIVEKEIFFQGPWIDYIPGRTIKNAYLAKCVVSNYNWNLDKIVMLPFEDENEAILVVSETKIIINSDWNTICKRCGAPAYQGLLKVECSKKCI